MRYPSDVTRTFPELPGWTFDIDEISIGIYRCVAVDSRGRRIDLTGTDPEVLIDECKQSARSMVSSLS